MRKRVKEAAQMYGLLMLDIQDLLDACETISEAKEAISYAEDYGDLYDFWCERQCKKHQEIEEAWKSWPTDKEYYMSWEEIYPLQDELPERYYSDVNASWLDVIDEDYTKAEEERNQSYWTEEELQDTFDWFAVKRIHQIAQIAKQAKEQSISENTVRRFMKEYHLTRLERCIFWYNYKQ